MLLDAIFFIPTLFTYCLILLLIFILCFIVVYISHKIYISIYDNLPLDRGSTAGLPMQPLQLIDSHFHVPSDQFVNQTSMHTIWIQNRSQICSSRAVRFVLSLEPTYLACVQLDAPASMATQRVISFTCSCPQNDNDNDNENAAENEGCAAAAPRPYSTRITKYYDKLSKIPRYHVMLRCTQRSMESHIGSNMRHMLDDVILDVTMDMDANQTNDACRPAARQQHMQSQRPASASASKKPA